MSGPNHLGAFTQLPLVSSEEERRSLWRQSMATLARAALEQQPVPLEGIDPKLLLEAVRAAFGANLITDLDWLSPSAAAAAVYELAAAIPMGAERRQLGRTARVRAERNAEEAAAAIAVVREGARGDANMLRPMREALRARCTVGEICEALREEWGMYDAVRPRA